MASENDLLRVRNLSKAFSGKKVVDGVNMSVCPGEVVALIGENGAGKSTLKNMLVGLLKPTGGEIFFGGKNKDSLTKAEYRVAAVHQELSVFPSLSVAENICITDMPGKKSKIDWKECRRKAKGYLEMVGVELDLDMSVALLGPGERQLVEIAKALYQNPLLLILDEPTASLSAPERAKLFEVMRTLKRKNVGMIFVTHFIDEVYEISDNIVVLRNGVHVGGGRTDELPRHQVEEMLVGREMKELTFQLAEPRKETALAVKGFNSSSFVDVNFEIKCGEILGLAGLMGAGRTEIVESIFGLRETEGSISVFGKEHHSWTPRMMMDNDVIFVSEDRRTTGIFPYRSLKENITVANLENLVTRKVKGIGFRGERQSAVRLAEQYNVSYPDIEQPISALSGGNQQKAILARWMALEPKICIFDDPTRGVDIGAKEDISKLIMHLAERGCAIIIVSSDIKELVQLSHRILIMRQGHIVAEVGRNEFDAQRIIAVAATTTAQW